LRTSYGEKRKMKSNYWLEWTTSSTSRHHTPPTNGDGEGRKKEWKIYISPQI